MEGNKGKGLNSLLSDSDLVVSHKIASFKGVKAISIDKIITGSHQPRTEFDEEILKELADSIKVHGIIQPITVREKDGLYEIISGERRFRASKDLGLETIPAYIRNVDDAKSLELALIENIQREDLNPIEIAISYQRMINECDLKQEELGERLGKNRSTVTNYLRLLQLPIEIQTGLVLGKISIGQARPLIALTDSDFQLELFQKIVENGLSSRKVEALVKMGNAFESEASAIDRYREDMRIEEITLKGKTKVPFKIQVQDIDKGNISIKFDNEDQLNGILSQLGLL
jgi:ParB family transcriptional regulator, chromosome partitioning protein